MIAITIHKDSFSGYIKFYLFTKRKRIVTLDQKCVLIIGYTSNPVNLL